MNIKGRTLAAFMVLGMLAGALITLTVLDFSGTMTFADGGNREPADNRQAATESTEAAWQQAGMTEEQMTKIATAFQIARSKFYMDIEKEALVDGAIDGILNSLNDPYSVYMNAEEAEQFNESVIESQFSGIGAEVTMEDGRVTVVAPIKGSPAEKAGIRAKDVILSVNGERLEGLTLNDAVLKIRGPKGTQAELEVQRPGSNVPLELTVVRDDIDVETVFSEMLEGKLGKIEIRQFAQNTGERFHEELAELEKQGMKGLIIDVRNNPGGILPVVIELVEPLIPKGKTIVQVEDREGQRQQEVSEGSGKTYPIAVLTNKGSASASEILAAAIKESAGGALIGESTFGKGLVQSTYDSGIGDGSSVKVTIAKWLTPDGNFINEKGIEPTIKVEQPVYFQTVPLPKDKSLKLDDLGAEIANLQLMLDGLGLKPQRSDGYFDANTELAVKTFQKAHELPVTGVVDKTTAEKLEQQLIEKMLNPENDYQLMRAKQYLTDRIK